MELSFSAPRTVFTLHFHLLLALSFLLFCFPMEGKNHFQNLTNESKMKEPCSSSSSSWYSKPVHFVLVHGFGGGAWSWYKIQPLLEASGYKVTAIDLKGAGIDPTNSSRVCTFDTYNEPLIKFLHNLMDYEKVILVGYSSGGLSVTDASHKFSHKIRVAVYIAATMLKHGYETEQDLRDGAPAFAIQQFREQKICPPTPTPTPTPTPPHDHPHPNSPMANEPKVEVLPPFTGFQFPEDAVLAGMLSRYVPLKAFLTAKFKGDAADRVRRVYIKTKMDHTLLPDQQDAMISRWPPSDEFVLQTDHNLISTDPFVLFSLLVKVADSIKCTN